MVQGFILSSLLLLSFTAQGQSDLTQWVKPMIGTGGFSVHGGMTFPGPALPFAVVQLGPDTFEHRWWHIDRWVNNHATSGYAAHHSRLMGFSHHRLSGVGVPEAGHFRIIPSRHERWYEDFQGIPFSKDHEHAALGLYKLDLPREQIRVELTSGRHVGAHNYQFSGAKPRFLTLEVSSCIGANCWSEDSAAKISTTKGLVTGHNRVYGGLSKPTGGVPSFFALKTQPPFQTARLITPAHAIHPHQPQKQRKPLLVQMRFPDSTPQVELRLAMSFASEQQAIQDLEREAGFDKSFTDLYTQHRTAWIKELAIIQASFYNDTDKQLFYTAYYHSLLHPNQINLPEAKAASWAYLSLWDTFRTQMPLLSLTHPNHYRNIIDSLHRFAAQNGYYPQWLLTQKDSLAMTGHPAFIVLAEAWAKNLNPKPFTKAWPLIQAQLTGTSRHPHAKRHQACFKTAYCPTTVPFSVSQTIETAWAAEALHRVTLTHDPAEHRTDKQLRYSSLQQLRDSLFKLWNTDYQLFWPKNSDGSWHDSQLPPWLRYTWNLAWQGYYHGNFAEGSPAHWLWSPILHRHKLTSHFNSPETARHTWEQFFQGAPLQSPIWPKDHYWHGNEHHHHAALMLYDTPSRAKAQSWLQWIKKHRYSSTPEGLAGNDDLGSLSSWYVFASLGFIPLPGTDKYFLTPPHVTKASLSLEDEPLEITVQNPHPHKAFLGAVFYNGQRLCQAMLTHNQLCQGGQLTFVLADHPQPKGGFACEP